MSIHDFPVWRNARIVLATSDVTNVESRFLRLTPRSIGAMSDVTSTTRAPRQTGKSCRVISTVVGQWQCSAISDLKLTLLYWRTWKLGLMPVFWVGPRSWLGSKSNWDSSIRNCKERTPDRNWGVRPLYTARNSADSSRTPPGCTGYFGVKYLPIIIQCKSSLSIPKVRGNIDFMVYHQTYEPSRQTTVEVSDHCHKWLIYTLRGIAQIRYMFGGKV